MAYWCATCDLAVEEDVCPYCLTSDLPLESAVEEETETIHHTTPEPDSETVSIPNPVPDSEPVTPIEPDPEPESTPPPPGPDYSAHHTAASSKKSKSIAMTISEQYRKDAAWAGDALGHTEMQLLKWRNQGKKIIAVIGFYDSGKTFFVNRLRQILKDKRGWDCDPSPEHVIDHTPDGVGYMKTDISDEASYVLLDIAGESFFKGFHINSHTGESSKRMKLNPKYLGILALADAFILVISANTLPLPFLTPESEEDLEKQKSTHDFIYNFTRMIALIKNAERRFKSGEKAEELLKNGVTGEQIKAEIHNKTTSSKPLHVLYSMADIYLEKTGDDHFDEEPFLFSYKTFPALTSAIEGFFNFYRFDFLSAFPGQKGTHPNYSSTPYGAWQAFMWIHNRLSLSTGRFSKLRNFLSGLVSTRQAMDLRCRIDPKFRENVEDRTEDEDGGDLDEL